MVPQGHVLRGGRIGVELQPGGRCTPTRAPVHPLAHVRTDLAEAAHQPFADLFQVLAKPSKSQPQPVEHVIQGVLFRLTARRGCTGTDPRADRQDPDHHPGSPGRRLPQPHGRTEVCRTPVSFLTQATFGCTRTPGGSPCRHYRASYTGHPTSIYPLPARQDSGPAPTRFT